VTIVQSTVRALGLKLERSRGPVETIVIDHFGKAVGKLRSRKINTRFRGPGRLRRPWPRNRLADVAEPYFGSIVANVAMRVYQP
jgi:hypothetical protein